MLLPPPPPLPDVEVEEPAVPSSSKVQGSISISDGSWEGSGALPRPDGRLGEFQLGVEGLMLLCW